MFDTIKEPSKLETKCYVDRILFAINEIYDEVLFVRKRLEHVSGEASNEKVAEARKEPYNSSQAILNKLEDVLDSSRENRELIIKYIGE